MSDSYQEKIAEVADTDEIGERYKTPRILTVAVWSAAIGFVLYLATVIAWICVQPSVDFAQWQPGTFGDAFGVLTCVFTLIALVGVYQTLKLDTQRAESAEIATRKAERATARAQQHADMHAREAAKQAEKAIHEANNRAREAAAEATRQARKREKEIEENRVIERFWTSFSLINSGIQSKASASEFDSWANNILQMPIESLADEIRRSTHIYQTLYLIGSWYKYWESNPLMHENLKIAALILTASVGPQFFRVALRARAVINEEAIRMAGRMARIYFNTPNLNELEVSEIKKIDAEIQTDQTTSNL